MTIKDIINKVHCADCVDFMKQMPDDCIDLVITSPPYYGLRDYQVDGQIGLEDSFDEFLKKILKVTAEIKRVLKPTGQFWLNMGDCYGGIQGRGEGKGNEHGQKVPQRLKYWGGNVEKSTLTNPERQQKMGRAGNFKCMLMQPERLSIKLIDEQGWILRNKIKWAKQILIKKQNKTIGSVMPTSVKDRFNESGEELYFFVKNKKYYSDLDAVRLKIQTELETERSRIGNRKTSIKFNYRVKDTEKKKGQPQFKASEEEINKYQRKMSNVFGQSVQGIERERIKWDILKRQKELEKRGGLPVNQRVQGFYDTFGGETNPRGKNLPSVWQIGSEPHNFKNELGLDIEHFAIFPQALLEIPIKFGCPKGGIILDPFFGSGTTGLVAKRLGRNYIGIELSEEYCKIAKQRLRQKPLL